MGTITSFVKDDLCQRARRQRPDQRITEPQRRQRHLRLELCRMVPSRSSYRHPQALLRQAYRWPHHLSTCPAFPDGLWWHARPWGRSAKCSDLPGAPAGCSRNSTNLRPKTFIASLGYTLYMARLSPLPCQPQHQSSLEGTFSLSRKSAARPPPSGMPQRCGEPFTTRRPYTAVTQGRTEWLY